MAKIRKINVSEIAGRSPFSNDNDAVMPAGTIVIYEKNINGIIEYVLRVHDGVTNGGVPFANAPSIIHNDDVNITVDSGDSSSYTWNFGQTGVLTLPPGGDIVDSTGASVLGGGSNVDNNIWVETFALTDPEESIVQIATSVEYDADGNIFTLFSHLIPGMEYETYKSVAKLTPTGAVLWQVRFGANLNTDGWGLAYDGADSVYIAGSTSGPDLDYTLATLTKIDAADGTSVWSKTYDFGSTSRSAVVDVDSDLNPIMVGWADTPGEENNRIITTKVDQEDGSVIWSRTLDGQGDDEAYGMAVGPSGEVVTVGYVPQLGIIDAAATLYTEPASNPNWTTGVSGPVGGVNFSSVTFTDGVPTFANVSDTLGNRTVDGVLGVIGGNAFGGTSPADDMTVKVATLAANDNDNRMVVIKYAGDGTIAWQKAVQFEVGYDCKGADADIDADGNIYVCGSYDNLVGEAMSLVKFNSSGVKQWSRQVIGNCQDFATSVVVGPDNNLYLSGVTIDNNNEDINWVVAKYSTGGTVVWQRLINNTASWTFAGGTFIGEGGGSNIAVRNGYVALGGGFGTLEGGDDPTAAVVQIDTNGTPFSTGDWDLTGASFSGTLDDTASGITVVNAGKTSGTATPAVADFVVMDDDSNFLVVTRYSLAGGNDSLVNGDYTLSLGDTGAVTLPAGGTITEGYVTSNPTIQLTPASPDVASQKLVIKGGGSYNASDNGIGLNWYIIDPLVGDTVEIYVTANAYANQTLYWWIYPEGAGIASPESGTVILNNVGSGDFVFTVDSDDYEFTVRVSPEEDNYGPGVIGVETQLFNSSAPTLDADHHLHLTTGNLAETSIFLGTDNHNVRTTVDGNIQITTPNETNNVWQFGADGSLTVPGDIKSETGINIDINLSDSTLRRWSFGEDGVITLPNSMTIDGSGTGGQTVIIGGDNTQITIDNNGAPPGFSVTTNALMSGPTGTAHTWHFGPDGELSFPSNKIKAPVSSNISIETEVPISDPPTTIVISGADFTAVNLTYTKDGANSIWYPAGYNPATDPYIEFGMGFGIFSPGFDQALYVNTGSLNEPLAQWNTNPPLGSVAPTGVYTYPNTYVHAWEFGTDGNLTLPEGGDILDSNGDSVLGGGGGGDATGVSRSDDNLIIRLTDAEGDDLELRNIVVDGNDMLISSTVLGSNGFVISTNSNVSQKQWQFGNDGGITFPDSTVQTTAWTGIPGPYADDSEAATAGVAIGYPYHKTGTSGQVFVRLA
jgi:hypothetical protein